MPKAPMTPRAMLRYLPLVLVVVLLAVVAVAAGAGGPRVGQVPLPKPVATGHTNRGAPPPVVDQTGSAAVPSTGTSPPSWIFILVGALLLAVAYGAVLLWLMLLARDAWIFRRRREREPADDAPVVTGTPSPAQVRAAVAAGLDVLITGDDPRAAVIACWLRLETLAERGGVPRQASDVPGDLVARMLAGTLSGDAVDALRELTEVYRAARYSPRPVPESARDTARAALGHISAALPAPVGGP